MKSKLLVSLFLLIHISMLSAQDQVVTDISTLRSLPRRMTANHDGSLLKTRIPPRDIKSGDLVVGGTDPNEVLVINGTYSLDGDLYIVNNGELRIEDTEFHIDGKIQIESLAGFTGSCRYFSG